MPPRTTSNCTGYYDDSGFCTSVIPYITTPTYKLTVTADDAANLASALASAPMYTSTINEKQKECDIYSGPKHGLPDEAPEAKTILHEDDKKMYVGVYKDGKLDGVAQILPAITNVEIYNDGVVKVWFSDGSTETAKASKEDKDFYNPETGVSICITKKLLHDKLGGNGSSVYNKLVDYAMRICNESVMKRYREEQEERTRKARLKRRREKAQKKKELKADARREEQIEIQAEAYLRAMKRAKEQE